MLSRDLLSNPSKILIVGLVLLGLQGCRKADAALEHKPIKAVPVKSASVASVTLPRVLQLTGELRGAKETDLAANVAGRVLSTKVERGQSVAKGDLLAQVDVAAAALALAEARVQVETSKTQEAISKTDCERYDRLKAGGVVSDLEYDQVTAKCKTAPLNVEAARARQSMAAKNVGDGVIRSPFAGVVTERYVEVGEYVQASSRVVSLAQVDELKLVFSVPEQNFPDVKQDAEVKFGVAAYGDRVFSGRVVHISGAVRDTRDVLVEAIVPNPDKKLLPGMFADIRLTIGQESLPGVPKSAVFEKNGKLNAFVVKDGLLEQRVLQPAATLGDRVPVRRGIKVGEQVVVAQVDKLQNGQPVQ
jgi:membrane fusion protein (multidrug efflux system)